MVHGRIEMTSLGVMSDKITQIQTGMMITQAKLVPTSKDKENMHSSVQIQTKLRC